MNEEIIPPEKTFTQIATLIRERRSRAMRVVNHELIELYWEVGKILFRKTEQENWGKKVISDLADYLKQASLELKGFSRRGLYRMRQFYEIYRDYEIVPPAVRQLHPTADSIFKDNYIVEFLQLSLGQEVGD